MKVPDLENPNMDNKLKFSDRLKALLKTESRQDVDPYIFSEPEPFVTAAGKNFKLMQPKNPRANSKNNKTRGKCIKRRVKIEGSGITQDCTMETIEPESDADVTSGSLELRFSTGIRQNPKEAQNETIDGVQRFESRRQNRDHTLLYYPRAGDEISDSESSGDELSIYQRHWFAGETSVSLNRSTRLSQLRSQLRRRLIQLHKGGQDSEIRLRERTRCLLEAACKKPRASTRSLPGTSKLIKGPLLVGGPCSAYGCRQTCLPCTRYCSRHIMLNTDQLLFEHCTAKFSDNTQCCVPVFDVAHELPLCPEHARKRDNYHRKAQESKPKKSRKKPASPVIPRPKSKSRPKKRKRPPSTTTKLETKIAGFVQEENHFPSQVVVSTNENHTKTLNNLNVPQSTSANLNLGLGLGTLGPASGSKVELGDHEVFASLYPAEHDFSNALMTLPADAFNDIFIGKLFSYVLSFFIMWCLALWEIVRDLGLFF